VKRFNEGRSFVTTGPMLLAQMDQPVARVPFQGQARPAPPGARGGSILSDQPVEAVEVVVNGQVSQRLTPKALS